MKIQLKKSYLTLWPIQPIQTDMKTEIRLNKLLSDCGLTSRREADRWIVEGAIQINGKKIFTPGVKVIPGVDRIVVRGKPLKLDSEKVYYAFNKPTSVLTTLSDPAERPTIGDYVSDITERVYPVGRLDWDSEGLILLTNDGDWAQKIMHPKAEVTKTYMVKVDGQPRPDQLAKLLRGVPIIGGRVAAKHVERIRRQDGSKQYDWIKIVITEGKNRQIRQMFQKIGFDVLKLQRVCIGRLKLGSLQKGELRELNEQDLKRVFQADDPVIAKAIAKRPANLPNKKFERKTFKKRH